LSSFTEKASKSLASKTVSKTTVELPDDLYGEANARAALEGIKLKDLVADALCARLHATREPHRHPRVKFPIIEGDPDAPPITTELVKKARA
jgi:hypothetical protein